jgi:beta-glucuronidase
VSGSGLPQRRGARLLGPILLVGIILAGVLVLLVPGTGRRPSHRRAGVQVPQEGALYRDGSNGRYLLDSGWTTAPDPNDVGLEEHWQRPGVTAGFRPVAVPNAFNARDLTARGFRSRVQWYRLRFVLPHAAGATGWRFRFESVSVGALAFLNGRRIGSHRGAYLPFELPAAGVKPGVNELVVRVDGRARPSDVPPSNRQRGWWNYGGLLREVYLRRVMPLDLADLQITTGTRKPAHVTVRATVRNTSSRALPLAYRLVADGPGAFRLSERRSASALPPGALGRLATSFEISNPRLWSPRSPSLYSLRLVLEGGQTTRSEFGIRHWTVGPDGQALLNGRPLSLRGTSFQEQTANHGGALSPADRDRLVGELRALRADFARVQYPPHPALLEAFDRLGIVLWEQIPVWRLRAAQLGSPTIRRTALRDLRQTILRDRDHASVMAWSVENETLRGGAAEAAYLRAAKALVRRLDPTRFFAADQALVPRDYTPPSYRLLDALGIEEYLGWYGGDVGQLAADLADVRSRFPRQALFITEVGAEANRTGPPSEKGTFAFQRRFLDQQLRTLDRAPWLSGALVWLLRDFAVRPGWSGGNPHPDPPLSRKGLFDERGRPKPAFATVRSRFDVVAPTR